MLQLPPRDPDLVMALSTVAPQEGALSGSELKITFTRHGVPAKEQ